MENEINFKEVVYLLNRNKVIIIIAILLGLASVLTWFFLSPKVYMGVMTIEIGKLDGKVIENPLDVVEKINVLSLDNLLKLSASNPDNTNIIKIVLSTKDEKSAYSSLEKISNNILQSHNKKIDDLKNNLSPDINEIKKDISYLLNRGQDIVQLQLRLYNLQDTENNFENYYNQTIVLQKNFFQKKVNLTINLVFGGMLGLFLGLVFVFSKEYFLKRRQNV